jgi:peptidoglycan/xylan/chitin deacetylase (PgdA/CDA1 family)
MSSIAGRAISRDGLGAVSLRRGRAVPRIMVTFDDAFANLLDNALPVLEEFNIPAVIFAVTGNMGENPHWQMPKNHPEAQEPLMTGEQIAAVARNPSFRIGSHTVTHVDLTRVSRQQAEDELSQSKRQLEELLGTPVEDFALPHGAHDQHVMDMIQTAGYQRIFTIDSRLNLHSGHGGVIGRFSMSPDVWLMEFILTCAGAYAWLYDWRRLIRSIRRQPIL